MGANDEMNESGGLFPLRVDLSGLKFRVRGEYLNVRSGPGITFPEVAELKEGDIVDAQYLHSAQAWIEIEPGKFCALTYADVLYMERFLEEDKQE